VCGEARQTTNDIGSVCRVKLEFHAGPVSSKHLRDILAKILARILARKMAAWNLNFTGFLLRRHLAFPPSVNATTQRTIEVYITSHNLGYLHACKRRPGSWYPLMSNSTAGHGKVRSFVSTSAASNRLACRAISAIAVGYVFNCIPCCILTIFIRRKMQTIIKYKDRPRTEIEKIKLPLR